MLKGPRGHSVKSDAKTDGERFSPTGATRSTARLLYRALAELESDPRLADVYGRLATAEERMPASGRSKLRPRARGCRSGASVGERDC